jgi:hypothetical protein
MSTSAGGNKIEGTLKMVVSGKDGKTATLKTVVTLRGAQASDKETKIDLTKPYDPFTFAGDPNEGIAKVEKKEEARDRVTVGGREYNCLRQKVRIKAGPQAAGMEYDATLWLSNDVPLGGMVKMEMKSELFNVTLEFKETGSEKK